MSKKYNILWIDDEHEKMNGFKLQAAQNDILLKPYKSKNAGILEIQNNYPLYDGVLFDAKFFEDEYHTFTALVTSTFKSLSLLKLKDWVDLKLFIPG